MRGSKRHSFKWIIFLLLIVFLSGGCATIPLRVSAHLPHREKSEKILLMPMDIQLSTLTAGGILKPEAEWTAKANKHVEKAIREKMNQMDIRLFYPAEAEEIELDDEEREKRIQLIKLHEAVGHSILLHQYIKEYELPGKKGDFDWSLGPEARFLKEKYMADYALFVYLRDSYASAGRIAAFIVMAVFGVGIQMGQQVGFSSLVDLETGEVLWFNRLFRGAGDLRTEEAASNSVELLLSNFPE